MQIRIAREFGALYVAHGATGKGNDQVRFEMCAQALAPEITTIAPWRDPEFIESFKGRKDLLAYCTKHGIPVDAKPKANYSIDENLFHTSFESGMLEDANCPPDASMFKMTTDPREAPEAGEKVREHTSREATAIFDIIPNAVDIPQVQMEFKAGIPIKMTTLKDNVTKTDPLDIFLYANEVAGRNGVGRIDIVENRFVGIKSRGIYETPGGTLIREAHLDLEGITMDREVKVS